MKGVDGAPSTPERDQADQAYAGRALGRSSSFPPAAFAAASAFCIAKPLITIAIAAMQAGPARAMKMPWLPHPWLIRTPPIEEPKTLPNRPTPIIQPTPVLRATVG